MKTEQGYVHRRFRRRVILVALYAAVLLSGNATTRASAVEGDAGGAATASISGQALQKFQSKSEGSWLFSKNKDTGLPRMLMGAKSASYGEDPVEAAQAFLADNADMFLPGNLSKSQSEKVLLKMVSSKSLPGSAVVEFREEYKGIPVYGASLIAMVDAAGRINHVTSTVDTRVPISATPAHTFQGIDTTFRNSQSNGVRLTATTNTLVIFPGATPRLAYQVFYNVGDPGEPWEYILDADSGQVLKARRLVNDQSTTTPNQAVAGSKAQKVQNEGQQKLGQESSAEKPLAVYKVHVDLATGKTTTKKVDDVEKASAVTPKILPKRSPAEGEKAPSAARGSAPVEPIEKTETNSIPNTTRGKAVQHGVKETAKYKGETSGPPRKDKTKCDAIDESDVHSITGVPAYSTSPQASEKRRVK